MASDFRSSVRCAIEAIQRLVGEDEAAVFMGDLNDPVHPVRTMHEAGYVNCFSALGTVPTHPAYPTTNILPGARSTQQTIDWIFANKHARAVAAQVPHCYRGDVAPSNHWAVLAVYEVR